MSGSWCWLPFGRFVRPARALLFLLTVTAVIGTFTYIHKLETPLNVNNGNEINLSYYCYGTIAIVIGNVRI